jgi:hypothetical protein
MFGDGSPIELRSELPVPPLMGVRIGSVPSGPAIETAVYETAASPTDCGPSLPGARR